MYSLPEDQHKAHKAKVDQKIDWSKPAAPPRDALVQRKDGTLISKTASPLIDSEVVVAGFLNQFNPS